MGLILLIPSMGVAAGLAWLMTRRRGLEVWPEIAAILQLALHFLWSGVLFAITDRSNGALLPLASGLGVLTIAGISLIFRLRRPVGREPEVYGVLEPEAEDKPADPEVPEAWVVRRWRSSSSRIAGR
jgi:hypothetical protein